MAARSTITLGIEVSGAEAFKAALKACDAETRALNAEMQRLATSNASMDRGLSGMAQKYNLLGQAVEQGKAKMALLGQELEKAKQRLSTLAMELERAKQSGDPSAIQQATVAYERQRTVVAGLETNMSQTRQATDQAAQAMRDMTSNAIHQGLEKIKTAAANVAHGMSEVAKAAAQAASEIIDKMNKAVVGLTAAGTAMLVGLGKVGLEYNSQIENYVTNFTTLLGSTEKAAAKVEELKKMAAATPFGMEDLAKATQTLLSFGVQADKTTPILKALGDVSLGNKERFQSLALAFGQVSSAGKLTGQDLNQMINAGFNPLQEISKMTGKSMAELKEEMSKGAITAEMVEKAFIHATEAGGQFNNGMQAASQTMTGLISTLKDNATALVGQVFEPISNSIKNTLLPAALQYIQQLTDAFTKDGLPGLIRAVGDALGQITRKIAIDGPKIINQAVEIITMIAQRLQQSLPEMAATGARLMENLMMGLRQTLPQLGPIVATIAPTIVSTILQYKAELLNAGITIITQILTGLSKEAPNLVRQFSDCITELINTIKINLPQFLDAARDIIVSLLDGIKGNTDKAVDGIIYVITTCLKWINDNLDKFLSAALDIVMSLGKGISDNADKVVDATIQVITTALKWVIDNLDKVIDTALKIIMSLAEGLVGNIPKVVDAIRQVVESALNWVIQNLDKVVETAITFIITMAKAMLDSQEKLISAISQLITSMLVWITEHLDQVILTAVKIVGALIEGLLRAQVELLKSVAGIVAAMIKGFADAVTRIPEVGRNIVQGLWQGILSVKDWLSEKIGGFFGGIIDGAKRLLGIHSPSTVFAGIGENIGLGLANGIRDSAGIVQSAMDYIMPSAGNISMGMDTMSVAGRVADGGGYSPFVDNRPIILKLNDRELARFVRGYA